MHRHVIFSLFAAIAIVSCVSAAKASQYNVSSLDGHTVVGINVTTGLVDHVYASNGSTDALIDVELDARTVLEGCAVVPGTLSFVVQGGSVTALRTLSCAPATSESSFQIKLTEYYIPRNTSVQWKATVLVVSGMHKVLWVPVSCRWCNSRGCTAPDCQASRCQPCIPSNTSAAGNCCGYMECVYDKVFKEFICLPNEPWICEPGSPLLSPAPVSKPSSDIPGYTGTISLPIVTELSWTSEVMPSQYWTARGKGSVNNGAPSQPISSGTWSNPLRFQAIPASPTAYRFGASPQSDVTVDAISLPLVCHAFESGVGLSFALDPNDSMLDVFFNVSSNGTAIERRYLRQTGGSDPVAFSGYFTSHGADWRPGWAHFSTCIWAFPYSCRHNIVWCCCVFSTGIFRKRVRPVFRPVRCQPHQVSDRFVVLYRPLRNMPT
jgi:hypothetical protein